MDHVYLLKDKKGKFIVASFMDSGRLEYLAPLKIDLFQAALEYTLRRSADAARSLNHALLAFVEFLNQYTFKNSEITDLDAITYEMLFTFKKYYQESGEPPKRINRRLGQLFNFLKMQDLGIRIPKLPREVTQPREPLKEKTLDQLIRNLRNEARQIASRQKTIERALKTGREITFNSDTYFPSYTIENICYWYLNEAKERKLSSYDREYYPRLRNFLSRSKDPKLRGIGPQKFTEKYHSNNWIELAKKGVNPTGENFHRTRYKLEDVLVTMANNPDWVLCEKRFDTWNIKSLDNAWEAICFRITRSTHSSDSVDPIVIENFAGGVQELKALLFPSLSEAMAIFSFIGIQTGWNPEVIARIDRLNPEHPLSRSIDPDKVILASKKRRSQQSTKDRTVYEKEMHASSNLNDKYSAVNLLNLYLRRTQLLRTTQSAEKNSEASTVTNPVFIYRAGSVVGVLEPGLNKGSYRALKGLIKEYDILLGDGSKLTSLDLNKLRPTWLEAKISTGTNENFLSLLMGHSCEETTDLHYNNHSRARRRRKNRLRVELNAIVLDLNSSEFKGYVSTHTLQEIQDSTLREGQVFTDAKDRMICVCLNSTSPTWPGADRIILPGEQCTYLSKCTQCKQCVVTRDSLPYLVDRHQYITGQSNILSAPEYDSLYGLEKSAIDVILEGWPDFEQVEEAMIIASTEGPLLPSDLVIPEIALETG